MQTQTRKNLTIKMHSIILAFIGIFTLITATYPLAMMRVSQEKKFQGTHVKSLTMEGKSDALSIK
jgi:hypothetical protein